jgi:hypothetical protein
VCINTHNREREREKGKQEKLMPICLKFTAIRVFCVKFDTEQKHNELRIIIIINYHTKYLRRNNRPKQVWKFSAPL